MDANQNGILELSEVPEERRGMLRGIAGRMGLDPEKPIPLDQIREAMSRRSRGEEAGPPPDGSQQSSDEKSADEAEPLVPGFGVEQDLAPVPAFGERVEYPGLTATGSSSRSGSSGSSRSRGDRDSRVRYFARAMLRRADRNRSGALERDEWEGVRDAEAADRNDDGVITLDEMTERLSEYSRRRERGEDSRGDSSESSSRSESSRSKESDGRTSYRFLTATERLPEGLPDWFARNDADGDGQVAMAEYSTYWSDSKVREFARFDLNGDGMITPRECLDAEATGEDSAGALGGPPGGPPRASPGGPLGGPPPGAPNDQGESKPWWLQ